MKFYCVKCKKSATVADKKVKYKTKNNTKFAVAKHSCGTDMYRIIGRTNTKKKRTVKKRWR